MMRYGLRSLQREVRQLFWLPAAQVSTDECVGRVKFQAAEIDPGLVKIIAKKEFHLTNLVEWLVQNDFECELDNAIPVHVSSGARQRRELDYLFVDVDCGVELEDLIDDLLVFRNTFASTKVILVSSGFLVDDFGFNRLGVCDASLRWPVTFSRLELGLVMAEVNNAIWQDRLRISE